MEFNFFISIVMGMKTPQMIPNMHYEHDKLKHIMLESKSNHTQKLIHMQSHKVCKKRHKYNNTWVNSTLIDYL